LHCPDVDVRPPRTMDVPYPQVPALDISCCARPGCGVMPPGDTGGMTRQTTSQVLCVHFTEAFVCLARRPERHVRAAHRRPRHTRARHSPRPDLASAASPPPSSSTTLKRVPCQPAAWQVSSLFPDLSNFSLGHLPQYLDKSPLNTPSNHHFRLVPPENTPCNPPKTGHPPPGVPPRPAHHQPVRSMPLAAPVRWNACLPEVKFANSGRRALLIAPVSGARLYWP